MGLHQVSTSDQVMASYMMRLCTLAITYKSRDKYMRHKPDEVQGADRSLKPCFTVTTQIKC